MVRRGLLVIGVLVSLFAPLGCTGGGDDVRPDPTAGKPAPVRQADAIKKIEDNPNMPDQAKQMAIAALKGQGHQGGK